MNKNNNHNSDKLMSTILLKKLSDKWFLLCSLLLGTILRFMYIGHPAVWHDEGFTMLLAPLPVSEIIHRTALDVHPPLYYISLHFWISLFGTSETAIRSLSALFMIGVIFITFFMVRRLYDSTTARLATIFVATAPFLIRYSQETRMYGMLAFLAALATYMFIRARATNKWLDWLIYSVALTAGLYTNYYMIYLIAFHWLYVIYLAAYPKLSWQTIKNQILRWRWLLANALAMLAFLPWLPTVIRQYTSIQNGYWIPPVNADTIPITIARFLTYSNLQLLNLGSSIGRFIPTLGVDSLFFFAFIVVLLVYLWQNRRNNQSNALFTLYALLAPCLVFLVSLGRPVFVDRYFVFAAVAFYVLIAILILHARPFKDHARRQLILTLSFMLIFIASDISIYRHGNTQMRDVATGLQANYSAGDSIVNVNFYTYFDYHYYNHTGTPNLVYVPNGFPGCCEGKSLLFDHPEVLVKNLATVKPVSGYVWLIGQANVSIPLNWLQSGPSLNNGNVPVVRYLVR